MNCPVCNEPMVVLEHESVEVDFCVSCEGIWLDAGEIELLFEDPKACAAVLEQGDAAPSLSEKPRRCPECGKKMAKAATSGDEPVTYDRCARGDGLWFDKGELADVLRHGRALGDGRVSAFLEGIFGVSE